MSNYFRNFDQKRQECKVPRDREFSRILSAAVVNQNFCRLLLSDPALAIRSGYGGEDFHLANEETQKLSSIRASSLAEFARQMNSLTP